MSYGIKVYDSSGGILLDATKMTWAYLRTDVFYIPDDYYRGYTSFQINIANTNKFVTIYDAKRKDASGFFTIPARVRIDAYIYYSSTYDIFEYYITAMCDYPDERPVQVTAITFLPWPEVE